MESGAWDLHLRERTIFSGTRFDGDHPRLYRLRVTSQAWLGGVDCVAPAFSRFTYMLMRTYADIPLVVGRGVYFLYGYLCFQCVVAGSRLVIGGAVGFAYFRLHPRGRQPTG